MRGSRRFFRLSFAASSVRLLAVALVAASLGLAACGDGDDEGASAETLTAAEDTTTTAQPSGEVDGEFDVGDHSLYLKCRGTEAPTIVYMHGSITEASVAPHSNGEAFLTSLSDDHRVCVYDRRNLGRSETVDAPQLPEDAIADMHELLNAAGVEPPYVLLGASFGGLLSYLYANTYPDEVAGMVLLDSPFPDQLSLEHLVKPADRYEAFSAEDENESLERISHFKTLEAAHPYIGEEPAIPVTFLSSIPESDAVLGIPKYDKKALRLQEAYVERFSPGEYLRVDAPHFMEDAIPEKITRELRQVIATAGY